MKLPLQTVGRTNVPHSNASRSAEEFFKRAGYEREVRQSVLVREVVLENAVMTRRLLGSLSG